MPAHKAMATKVGSEERETAYENWRRRRKQWDGRRAADGPTDAAFMDMPFACSVEEADYKAKLSELIGRLQAEN